MDRLEVGRQSFEGSGILYSWHSFAHLLNASCTFDSSYSMCLFARGSIDFVTAELFGNILPA